ncbi:MAG: hypothetical protein SynsKO_36880 [Synoicihabitans sp.]
MLAAACERAGIEFEIYDQGHASAASRVGAGLVSPLTGRRLVPTWRFPEWRDRVLQIYRRWEEELELSFVREMAIRRLYRDVAQRELFETRMSVPEVSAWVVTSDAVGIGMTGAIQVETGKLIASLRARWKRSGRLREGPVRFGLTDQSVPTIWCVGAALSEILPIPWRPSRGEIVRGSMHGLDADTVLNDGHWLIPSATGEVKVGSTFDRENLRLETTASAQAELVTAAERLGGRRLRDPVGDVGLRVAVPDHRPVVGWRDDSRRLGVFGGLAAKGALWAPILAEQWVEDQLAGEMIEPEARADRFGV